MCAYRALAANDPKIVEHFLGMSAEDRRCRFHGMTSDERIAQYCAEMTQREAHLIGCLEGERLVGLIEIALCGDGTGRHGEVGMSVAADRRDRGIGHVLVQHALDYAANHGVPLVFGYLPDNTRIPRIVHDLGGHVDRLTAEAELEAPVPTPFSVCLEAIDDAGLLAADAIEFWRKTLLAPFADPRPVKPTPTGADWRLRGVAGAHRRDSTRLGLAFHGIVAQQKRIALREGRRQPERPRRPGRPDLGNLVHMLRTPPLGCQCECAKARAASA